MKLNSAYLCVDDMDRGIDFWENFLEQEITFRHPTFSSFTFGGFRLCLFAPDKVGESYRHGDNCLLSFEVEDFKKLKNKLARLKAKIIYGPKKIGKNLVLEFQDSEGNDVEAYQWVG